MQHIHDIMLGETTPQIFKSLRWIICAKVLNISDLLQDIRSKEYRNKGPWCCIEEDQVSDLVKFGWG